MVGRRDVPVHSANRLSFFQFCNMRSKFKDRADSDPESEGGEDEDDVVDAGHGPVSSEESDDSAAPPPIRMKRAPRETGAAADEGPEGANGVEGAEERGDDGGSRGPKAPEMDELGYPVNALPAQPITDFSRRNFFALINYLRVVQKMCKGKAHRNLLLVQYKSSTILRKSLRVPQEELRLYTLKLFKNQVPYCGRKWRQSNMRVITAIYLHCRPELRDEWLAGSDVDAEVEGALPQEQALRGITHWHNVRRYPAALPAEVRAAARDGQHNFFARELERLDAGWAEAPHDEAVPGGDAEYVEGWA